jgi:hypothetical protein
VLLFLIIRLWIISKFYFLLHMDPNLQENKNIAINSRQLLRYLFSMPWKWPWCCFIPLSIALRLSDCSY